MKRKPPYAVDLEITNLTILEVTNPDVDLLKDVEYLVCYGCCGKIGILKHQQIVLRIRHDSSRCRACAADKNQQKRIKKEIDTSRRDYGVSAPAWPRPAGGR